MVIYCIKWSWFNLKGAVLYIQQVKTELRISTLCNHKAAHTSSSLYPFQDLRKNYTATRFTVKSIYFTCVLFLYGWVFSIIWPDFSTSSSFTMLIFPRPGRDMSRPGRGKVRHSNLAIVIYTLSMKS